MAGFQIKTNLSLMLFLSQITYIMALPTHLQLLCYVLAFTFII